ncbi:MAG: T9SS type A sorting domain-containing protein [Saprospiraceae bacterium]
MIFTKLLPFIIFNFFLSLLPSYIFGQGHLWNKIHSKQINTLGITCFDSKGNYYVTNSNVSLILKANIYSGQIESLSKPILNNQQANYVRLFSGHDEEFFAFLDGVVCTYKNNNFEPVLLPGGKIGMAQEPMYLAVNSLSNMFEVGLYYIYRYDTNWNLHALTKLYNNGNAYIYAPSFYVPDTNFILEDDFSSGRKNIINLNTTTGAKNNILEFNAPIQQGKFAILERDGRFYIPTSQELFYYKDFGKELFVPDIDFSSGNGYIEALTRGKINKELVIYKGGKFYISYDDCKTWVGTGAMNSNFPKGRINQIVVWDSLHAIAVVTDECVYDHLYYLNGNNKSWKSFYEEKIDNLDLTYPGSYQNGDMLALINSCNLASSSDQGATWNLFSTLKVNGSSTYYGNFIHTEIGDYNFVRDTLYLTTDYGKTWVNAANLPDSTRRLDYLGSGKFFITTDTFIGNGTYNEYYISYDYCKTFQPKFLDLNNRLFMSKFSSDHNNNILNYKGGNGYYLSTDDGASWNQDPRFTTLIFNLEFTKDGEYFMTTKRNKINSLYSTKDFINYIDLTAGLRPYSKITFDLLDENQLVVATYDKPDVFNLYYSSDRGSNWQKINYDIDVKRSEDRLALVNYFFLSKNNEFFMSLANDGLYKLSGTIATSNISEDLEINIFPQPAMEYIQFGNLEFSNERYARITDLLGRELSYTRMESNILSVASLISGVYMVELVDNNKIIWTGKMMKE